MQVPAAVRAAARARVRRLAAPASHRHARRRTARWSAIRKRRSPARRTRACCARSSRWRAAPACASSRSRADDARRLRLDVAWRVEDRTRVLVSRRRAAARSRARDRARARQHQVEVPFDDFERTRRHGCASWSRPAVPARRPQGARGPGGDRRARSSSTTRSPSPPRARIDAPALGLVQKLDPAVTVPARINGRLRGGSGTLPVVAAARLVRRPARRAGDGASALPLPDVRAAAPLRPRVDGPRPRTDPAARTWPRCWQTNNRFIEAYLVGLNHEMARELLWREYPTDQRGTYFSSFWTGGRRSSSPTCTSARGGRCARQPRRPERSTASSCSWCAATWSAAIPAWSRTRRCEAERDEHGMPIFDGRLAGRDAVPRLPAAERAAGRLRDDDGRASTRRARRGGSRCRRTRPSRASASIHRATSRSSRDNLVWADFGVGVARRVPRRHAAHRPRVRRIARGARRARTSPTCSSSCPPARRSWPRRWSRGAMP